MEYEEVKIDKQKKIEMINKWIEDNPDLPHPTTSFFHNLGLIYRRLSRDGEFVICSIQDKKKYFMAKIKYGI